MRAWTPVERAYSSWLRAARERQGSAAALGRALEKRLRQDRGLAPDADLERHGVSHELSPRVVARWEKGTPNRQRPQIPSDPSLREALVEVVTDLVPVPPQASEWASFHDVCEALTEERLQRVEPSH
jgi:hypothetical protein